MTAPRPLRPTVPVGQPFALWTQDDARAILAAQKDETVGKQEYAVNKAYAEDGDHWQQGDPWVGPRGTEATEGEVLEKVERQFTPQDTIGEVLDALANALLEREPHKNFPPREGDEPDEPTTEMERLTAAICAWWENRDLSTMLRTVVQRSAWAGWATLRAWVPPSQLEQGGSDSDTTPDQALTFPDGLTLEQALDRVFVAAPEPEQALVYQDPETRDRVGIFQYDFDGDTLTELCWAEPEGEDGEPARVVIRSLKQFGDPVDFVLDLGGRIPIVQMEGDLLITESVRRQQAQLNFFRSNLTRVVETSGFPERYTLNAQPQGSWSTTAPVSSSSPVISKTDEAGVVWYLHPEDRTLGASVTTELVGQEVTSQGPAGPQSTLTTPGVVFKEPTDPDYIIKASRDARLAILRDCKQAHRAIDETATESGISRVQAKADFLSDVNARRVALEKMLRQLIEVALAYAAQMSDEAAAMLETYRAEVRVRVSPGPMGQEELTAMNERVKAGTLSLESALHQMGVDDVDAELQRIRTQPETRIAFHEKAATIISTYTGAGVPLDIAAQLVGLDEEELALIQRVEAESTESPETVAMDADTGEPMGMASPDPVSGGTMVRRTMEPQAPEPDPRIDALMTAVQQLAQQVTNLQQGMANTPAPQITVTPDITVNQPPVVVPPLELPRVKEGTIRKLGDGSFAFKIITTESDVAPPDAGGAAA